jgi:microcystin-dependent protein
VAQPYIGEIRMFGGNFAPQGWMFCNGQTLSISEYSALFQLIGTTYGGDGVSTFNLPDLQCRVPVHQGQGTGLSNYVLGQKGGQPAVTLTVGQLPQHSHTAMGNSGGASSGNPANLTWATNNVNSFAPGTSANQVMNAASIGMTGNNGPHDNMLPFQAVSFIIAIFGVFPTQ